MNAHPRHPWRRIAATLVALGAVALLWRWIAQPRARALRLPDGTEAYFRSGTTVDPLPGYPRPRTIRVNGDLFLRVPEGAEPLIVQTRLLILTLMGDTALRVTAFASQTGEEAEVLRGHVVVRKAYPSPRRSRTR